MNDLDFIYDNEEKKRNTALNLIDDCIFIVEIHALICCTLYYFVWQILPKKNEASFELIFQNCFINMEQYSGISYHYDYYFFMKLILP